VPVSDLDEVVSEFVREDSWFTSLRDIPQTIRLVCPHSEDGLFLPHKEKEEEVVPPLSGRDRRVATHFDPLDVAIKYFPCHVDLLIPHKYGVVFVFK